LIDWWPIVVSAIAEALKGINGETKQPKTS
jgi:hypothetical protein